MFCIAMYALDITAGRIYSRGWWTKYSSMWASLPGGLFSDEAVVHSERLSLMT